MKTLALQFAVPRFPASLLPRLLEFGILNLEFVWSASWRMELFPPTAFIAPRNCQTLPKPLPVRHLYIGINHQREGLKSFATFIATNIALLRRALWQCIILM